MIERHLHAVRLEHPGHEEPEATRARLRELFPRGATRRMTQLGLLLGSVLRDLNLGADDALVYASTYAESRAIEEYLDSFPAASPTLFQTSIHPSAVQQVLIARQQPVGRFFPLTGDRQLAAHALQAALTAGSPRAILCGGEERGTWLTDCGVASAETFAFAVVLAADPAGALGTVRLIPGDEADGALALPEFFALLQERRSLRQVIAPGLTLALSWH
ncbi:MAG TPA: hypothetical protein VMI53_01855 [Opitutaceae bacterium]|nr:hypothetical protein [Opitutaceae bacterium]